jgi:hypothetical protein
MRLTEAKKLYQILSLVCVPLIILLIIRRLLVIELEIISILTGIFWPAVGFIVVYRFLQKDGYTISVSEGMFIFFIVYCSVYFVIPSISLLLSPALGNDLLILILNFIITGIGWIGIACYIIF